MTFRVAGLILLTGMLPPDAKPEGISRFDVIGVPNVVEVHAKVLSGGQPEGAPAFARLAALGVKTIISVDGARPDVDAAGKYGLRYVHLPHGYDGVPTDRAMELSKAVRDLPGRVYIHCHHGRHRSPAAAAVACVGAGLLDRSKAETVLHVAGTGRQYLGLFDSARKATPFEPGVLNGLKVEFREVVPLPPLAKAMVDIDELAERVGSLERTGWKRDAADARPPQHAVLLLREKYRELLRDPTVQKKPAEFTALLEKGETKLADLEWSLNNETGRRSSVLWKEVQRNCNACHAKFRDVPQVK